VVGVMVGVCVSDIKIFSSFLQVVGNTFTYNQADALLCITLDVCANVTTNVFKENSPNDDSLWTIYVDLRRNIDKQVVKKNVFLVPDASYDVFLAMTRGISSIPVIDLSLNFWNMQNYSGILSR
jgi:hypothetical protein